MRIGKILSVLFLIAVLLMAGSTVWKVTRSETAPHHPAAPAVKTPGKVTITFDYQRMRTIASDQLAVWIEDAQGTHVRTLLVTRFTAGEGFQKRAEAVPDWQKAFQPATVSRDVLDAVSSATPPSGPVTVVWDCLDQTGKVVPAGTYAYKVEANIKWEKTALWQGTITVGATANQSTAASLSGDGALLQAVQADFIPTP